MPDAVQTSPAATRSVAAKATSRAGDISLTRFLILAAQLCLVVLVIHLFRVEETFGLLRITPVILGGFVVHAWLPQQYRRPFFLLLSFAAVGMVFGVHGVGLIAIGLLLIGICHLPVVFAARVALILVVAATLAAVRGGWLVTPWDQLPTIVLPILGSMFMFRLVVYLYDLRHEKKPATLSERLSYFFLLPNVCFPLFPVIDYQTYRRTYYDAASHEIYQKGVLWMFRGVTHLLLYRVIYLYFLPTPESVQNLGEVVQFMLSNYLLYLRISGQFHLIVGILCLFGFNLPETHHLYYLASSFNDYWRRINIYWKDFMMKIFYYPTFMKLRKFGSTTPLVVATIVVFLGTWILHSYQWFWLQGSFPLTVPDMLFWGILGALVVYNSFREVSGKRARKLGQEAFSMRRALITSAKIVAMFVVITVLWSLWSSRSVGEWISLLAAAGNSGPAAYATLVLAIGLLIAIGVLIQYMNSRGTELTVVGSHPSFRRAATFTTVGALALVTLGVGPVRNSFGERTSELVASIQEERLNEYDEEQLDRGYYEGLLDADAYTSALSLVRARKPSRGWEAVRESGAVRRTDNLMVYELLPSYASTYKDAPFETNRWGLRDKEYDMAKPAGTYRAALLGASYEMGAGVRRDQTFEALLEKRLNSDHAGEAFSAYEVLNFSVGGYGVFHYLLQTEQKVFDFEPDAVFYAIHSTEERRLAAHIKDLVRGGWPVPYPFLKDVMERSGVNVDMSDEEIRLALLPYLDSVIEWSLQEIAARCRERGIVPVWLFIPTTDEEESAVAGRFETLKEMAVAAGFIPIVLEDVYGDYGDKDLQLAPWDRHPNALGHRLIADSFYQALQDNREAIRPTPF